MSTTKLDDQPNLTPTFSGELNREAFAAIMEQKFQDSGMSERAFCEAHGINRTVMNRIRNSEATLETALSMLSDIGVTINFTAD